MCPRAIPTLDRAPIRNAESREPRPLCYIDVIGLFLLLFVASSSYETSQQAHFFCLLPT